MVTFEDVAGRGEKRSPIPKEGNLRGIKMSGSRKPRRNFVYTRETLQATVEELQASNEELKSTNEEMQSTKEELQSTNEELETSREELQSMNEELITVNAELQGKIDQLSFAEADMKVLLENTDIGIIFLDRHLDIERFTLEAKEAFNLIPSDIGRPLHDIRSNLDYNDVEKDSKEVLDPSKKRKGDPDKGRGMVLDADCLLPIRREYHRGMVLTFTDITEVKRTSGYESIVETVREPLLVLDGELK